MVRLYAVFIAILSITLTSNAWRSYEIQLRNLTFRSLNKNIDGTFTLNDSAIDALLTLKETFNNVFVHPVVFLDSGNGKYDLELLNRTINVCRFFRDFRYEPLFQVLYKAALAHGHFPTKCPLPKETFYLKRFRPSAELLPPGFPERKANFDIQFFRKNGSSNEPLGVFRIFAMVAKKYKSN